ncbi:MAG: methylmalonyl-CoA epimerase [Acidobacteria bacterium]|nr:methylmalonyl-CoA epimerase [Acidobacteriota bacterium]
MKLDHIGIAVRSLAQAVPFYESLGLPVSGYETLLAEKVRVAILPMGDARLELMEPTADDSPIAQFLKKRGEGLHHIAIEVRGLGRLLKELEAAGVRVISPKAEAGVGGHRYAFLHPASCGGVLVELVEAASAGEKMR